MSLSINQETKNNLTITPENKPANLTWNEASWSWDEETGTWTQPEPVLSKETKNNLTITNENKN